MSLPFVLRLEEADRALVGDLLVGGAERVGLDGVLAGRGARAWPACVRGAAARQAFRWNVRDTFDKIWWPQGIDVAVRDGRRVLAVSWFAQPARGVQHGVRVTFVDLRSPRRPRYHHVLLVDPVRGEEGGVRLDPVLIHAGGIGWLDDRILVADTFGGLRAFLLDDIVRAPHGVSGYDHVLPQHSRYRADPVSDQRALRFSFVSIEHGHDGGGPVLIAGEHGDNSRSNRLVRLSLDGRGETYEPGLYRMQGACIVDGTWFVTTSNGPRTGGDLWVGTPDVMTRHRHVLPAGPEDLAYDQHSGMLWSLSEWPGRRRVFTIDPERWGS